MPAILPVLARTLGLNPPFQRLGRDRDPPGCPGDWSGYVKHRLVWDSNPFQHRDRVPC
jgi:hypothetical protein